MGGRFKRGQQPAVSHTEPIRLSAEEQDVTISRVRCKFGGHEWEVKHFDTAYRRHRGLDFLGEVCCEHNHFFCETCGAETTSSKSMLEVNPMPHDWSRASRKRFLDSLS